MADNWRRGDYLISTDPARLDFAVVHGFLTRSYWSSGISRSLVEEAARHSLVFGIYVEPDGEPARQVGYARVITDHVAMGYLLDIFVLEEHRGRGLAHWLIEVILGHPALQEVRSWLLATRDAPGLYAKFGFERVDELYMRRIVPRPWMKRQRE